MATDVPEPMNIDLSLCALTIKASCGGCIHHSRMALPGRKKVCSDLGIIENGKPCKAFSPDPAKIHFKSDELMLSFAKCLATIGTQKLALVASIVNRERRTRQHGQHFGETVYIHAFGNDYLSNYRRCRVVSATRKLVHIEGKDGFNAMVLRSSIFKAAQWKKKKTALLADKKEKDPKYASYFSIPKQAILPANADDIISKNTPRSDVITTLEKPKRKNIRTAPLDKIIIR